MRDSRVSLPQLALVAVTRGVLGVGLGLLLAGRFGRVRRVRVGRALFAIGALSTLPLAISLFRRRRQEAELPEPDDLDALEVFGAAAADLDTVAVLIDPLP